MSTKPLMSWEGEPYLRWVKMHKGVRYRISCADLARLFPDPAVFTTYTKEGSVKAANAWWLRKRAELDAPPRELRKEFLERYELADLDEKIAAGEAAQRMKFAILTDPYEPLVKPEPLETLAEWAEQLEPKPQAPADRSLGHLVESYLQTEANRHRQGKLGLNRLGTLRIYLNHFLDWAGKDSPVECITAQKWLDFHGWLTGQLASERWGIGYCKHIWEDTKRFIHHCAELELIELPRNLDKRALAFTIPVKEPEIFTVEQVRQLLHEVTGQSKLHVLLMLNIGAQGADIASLRQDEVDWTHGIITRKRTKTKKEPNVPVVRYKLWPETFALLKKWRSKDEEVALLTKNGRRWMSQHITEKGTLSDNNMVNKILQGWLDRLRIERSPKQLRATAATMLGSHPTYKFYYSYFLGHSPRGIGERHYRKPTDGEFFEALDWLRETLVGKDGISVG